ncbi:MAG: hypothetical protein JWQ23_1284 [Herminiimonas sp.]|nr:hypothetical protein [Herminiimonas sp.]
MATSSTNENTFALRIEGRKWVNDISISQVWAILHAAYLELDPQQEMLFMIMLPSGEQPALCMDKTIFQALMKSPEAMARRLASMTGKSTQHKASTRA